MAKVKKMADGGDPMAIEGYADISPDTEEFAFDEDMPSKQQYDTLGYDTSMYRDAPMMTTTAAPTAMQAGKRQKPMKTPRPMQGPRAKVAKQRPMRSSNKPSVSVNLPSLGGKTSSAPSSFQYMSDVMKLGNGTTQGNSAPLYSFGTYSAPFKKGGASKSTTKMSTHQKSKKCPSF
jgi:hypothetical protein